MHVEGALRRLAEQHGVLRRDQIAPATLKALVRSGRVVRFLPGTYVDADPVHRQHTRLAAVLAHYPAALLWGSTAEAVIWARPATEHRVSIAVPHTIHPPAFVQAVYRRIPKEARVFWAGLALPSPAYLAVEAAGHDEGRLAERMLRERIVTPGALVDALAWFNHVPGAAIRRQVVRSSADNPWSGGERALQSLLREAGVTGWVANRPVWVGGRCYFPDILFEAERLILEFDGYEFHSSRAAFEADRIRMNHLHLAGYLVLRYTWDRLADPSALIREVRQMRTRLRAA